MAAKVHKEVTLDGVIVPAHFIPRWYQLEVLDAFHSGYKRIILFWHRKCGKDLTCISITAIAMVERVGNYFYVFPDAAQGRKILWEGIDNDGIPLLDRIPKQLIAKNGKNNTNMFLKLINGSTLQIVGADKYKVNSLVGIGPAGVVMSEFGIEEDYGLVLDFFRPALKLTGGWLLINGTPRGMNHYYDLMENVKKIPDRWFVSKLQTISPTYSTGRYTGLVTPEELAQELEEGMEQSTLEQEYGVSFNAGVQGSIFGSVMTRARETKRVKEFTLDDYAWVDTLWDLGNRDMTAIWFLQRSGDKIIWTDYFQSSDEDWPYYVSVLQNKGYRYRNHFLPHDGNTRYMLSKLRPKDILKECITDSGIGGKVKTLKRPQSKEALINATRRRFSYYHFDEGRCAEGIRMIDKFHRRYDPVRKVFTKEPIHDESSHCCDALMLEALINIKQVDDIERYSYTDYMFSQKPGKLGNTKKSILDRFNPL